MHKHLLIILTLLLIYPNVSIGCSCLAPGSFCESILGDDDELKPDIIVRGSFHGAGNQERTIKINQVLFGSTNQHSLLFQYSSCDNYSDELIVDREYVFALRQTANDFQLLACAISYLRIENEEVIGKIAPGIDRLPYKSFLGLEGCGGGQLNTLANWLSIFPNPTRDVLNIKNIGTERILVNLSINVFDVLGRNVSNRIDVEGILPDEVMMVHMSDLSPGVYIVRIYDRFEERVERIVKH